jgi:hypothetical protein
MGRRRPPNSCHMQTVAHNQLCVSEVLGAGGGDDDVCKRIASQQQAQQAWAQTTSKNYADATARGCQLAMANNPNLRQSSVDMQHVEEAAVLANAKAFMRDYNAEYGNQEYLEELRAQLGPPSSLTVAGSVAADCRQISTKNKSRINTNTLDLIDDVANKCMEKMNISSRPLF